MRTNILALYQQLSRKPFGHWMFSKLVCFKAPYFASISPRIQSLQPQRGVASIQHHRRITNHLGTVHAIALCNLAEFIGGLTTDVSIPASMRWIPKGMTVQYLQKATGKLQAIATLGFIPQVTNEGYALPMQVAINNEAGQAVFSATIDMWVSPRPKK